jgi:hypothetical protein
MCDPEEQRELIVGIDAGHRNNDLFGISAVLLPHSFQVSMGEIGGPQITGKGAAKRSGSEVLPKPAVETPGIETSPAFRVETHRELSTVDQGKARTGPRQLPPWAHELEPGIDQFQCNAIHGL